MKQRLIAVMYGWLTIILLLTLISLILALFLRFTSFTNPLLDQLAITAGFITLFFGGLISGIKAKQKGWIIGLILSLSYSMIIYLYQYLGYGEHFTLIQAFYHVGFLIVTIIGAIFGVNLSGNRQTN